MFREEMRYQYSLNQDSIVFDCGAHEGEFIEGIFSRYKCKIFAFEPLSSPHAILKQKYDGESKIMLYNFGLLDNNFETVMCDQGTSSSLFLDNEKGESVRIVDIVDFVSQNNFKNVDLIKINIEGGEYKLLPRIINSGCVNIFDNIQIQFHDNYTGFENILKDISDKLNKTHSVSWKFPMIWESWKRR